MEPDVVLGDLLISIQEPLEDPSCPPSPPLPMPHGAHESFSLLVSADTWVLIVMRSPCGGRSRASTVGGRMSGMLVAG